jgi:hypothetical protein
MPWARWRTKQPHGLDCDFFGKKAHLNLARLETLAAEHHLETDRDDFDRLRIVFVRPEHLQPAVLKPLLQEHLAGYLEMVGKK